MPLHRRAFQKLWRRRTVIGMTALICCGSLAASEAADNPTGEYVQATLQGSLGANRVGVIGVYNPPLHAQIGLTGSNSTIAWEMVYFAYPGQQIMVDRRCYSISVSPASDGELGGVGFAPAPTPTLMGRPWPQNTVVLEDGEGDVRILDGDDIQKAWELRALAWHPDQTHPTSVDIELLPLKLPRDYLAPADIGHIQLVEAGRVDVGPAKAEVLAIEGRTKLHPPRVVLRLSRLP